MGTEDKQIIIAQEGRPKNEPEVVFIKYGLHGVTHMLLNGFYYTEPLTFVQQYSLDGATMFECWSDYKLS